MGSEVISAFDASGWLLSRHANFATSQPKTQLKKERKKEMRRDARCPPWFDPSVSVRCGHDVGSAEFILPAWGLEEGYFLKYFLFVKLYCLNSHFHVPYCPLNHITNKQKHKKKPILNCIFAVLTNNVLKNSVAVQCFDP